MKMFLMETAALAAMIAAETFAVAFGLLWVFLSSIHLTQFGLWPEFAAGALVAVWTIFLVFRMSYRAREAERQHQLANSETD